MQKTGYPLDQQPPLPKLSAPAQRALSNAGITCLEDFSLFTEKTILDLHGVGPNAFNTIREELNIKGIFFARS